MDLADQESQWRHLLQKHNYFLCQRIGYGSFGDVFSVKTPDAENTKFAVKMLVTRRNILEDENAMMEIHSLLHLQHENIIPLQEVILTKKVACLVMELAPLGNLEMFFKLSEDQVHFDIVTKVFSQILRAVDFCHSGYFLAHRDINPSNVLVFNCCLVKLADFGLCFQCKNEDNGEDILCSDYLGHDNYIAPEVKMCKPFHAMPADVWSLGCVLRYLATGCHCSTIDQSTPFECPDNKTDSKSSYSVKTITKRDCIASEKHTEGTANKCHDDQNIASNNIEKEIIRFIKQFCQNSPNDRPSINSALRCWENAITCIDNDQCGDNSKSAGRTQREE